ncbi:chloride channel protein [Streptomyces naganishii]|uniref:Transport integral membrane protein n=1 Tax=Streptomyces naganishii JCM 4654 TaxID=1306179 RepID=A0A919CTQ5_9ACTN|nr:chloride channel protein [Streptomyces naganishii]GHD85252.1 transport integral membrane protein [Streptomyces naganishii JCM 4654]
MTDTASPALPAPVVGPGAPVGPLTAQRGLRRGWSALRESKGGLLVLSLLVGAGAGGGALVFRWLIETFTLWLSGHGDYSAAGHAANPHAPWLGRYFVLAAPVLAGLVYGPLVHRFAREARGHGVPEVMYAVARRGGRIAPQVAAVKALASALCIGGGGSVGREGPIVQIGSALGSTLGTWVKVAEDRLRVLVACGAAGGIAATFNAPLAGVFFAMELILRDFTAEAFGMVVLASVTASVIGRASFGNTPFLHLPPFHVQHLAQYGLFALLGLLAGVVGVTFSKVLYRVEDACDAFWRGPEWARPAAGGVLLGGLLLVLPQMYGVGYPVLQDALAGRYALLFLLALLVGKMAATSLTIGIGGSGGVFAPSLFIGAMLGSFFGRAAGDLLPHLAGPAGAYGLVGMGAVFAGAARAPITAVIILFELTGEYTIILPLMAAVVLATGVSRVLTGETIYTAKLRRRGVDIDSPAPGTPAAALTVRDAMEPTPATLSETTTLAQAADALARSPHGALPVLAADGTYRGVATARTVAETLADDTHAASSVGTIAHLPAAVTPATALDRALRSLAGADSQALPVLDEDRTQLIGWISHRSVLTALDHANVQRTAPHRDPAHP